MSRITDEDRALLRERDRYLEGEVGPGSRTLIRPEIAASWDRSIARMVDPKESLADFQRLGETQLSTAALPIIDHHLETLVDTRTSLLFSDGEGRLIGRWTHDSSLRSSLNGSRVEAGFTMAEGIVGTNGIGTVFESGMAVEIKGPEHFADHFLPFTCVGAPIRHPLTRRIVGVIDITCRNEDASPLAMPWILNLAKHIENQLLDRATVRERALLSAYLMAERKSQVAVACLNGQMVICNPDASALLSDTEQNHIWAHMQRREFRTPATFSPLELPNGRVLMFRGRPVRQDGVVLGAIVEAYEPQVLSSAPHEPATWTRSGLKDLVGLSDRWLNVCEKAIEWQEDDGGIVVVGESGVGKLAVIKATFAEEPHLTIIECGLVVVEGAKDWLAALRERLGDPSGVVVLRHVHVLDTTVARAVCSLLDQIDDPPRLAATVVTSDEQGPFEPLVDRFEVHRLEVPPLRHRLDDLPALVAELSRRAVSGGPRWLPETVGVLADQAWPDNVRGLSAVVRRVMRTRSVGVVTPADLPDEVAVRQDVKRTMTQLERLERQEIMETLNSVGGNKVLAAKKLNLARSTLYRKMTTLGIHASSPHTRARG